MFVGSFFHDKHMATTEMAMNDWSCGGLPVKKDTMEV